MPKRIQRKRVKDWKMPPNTVYVGRPTIWGNPWTIEEALNSKLFKPEMCALVVVNEFEAWLNGDVDMSMNENLGIWHKLESQRMEILTHISELRGKDLACWCDEGMPCHADVLLRFANEEGG